MATVLASYRLSREPAPSPITAIADKARRIAGQDLLRDSDFPHIHSNPLVLYDRELQQWQRVEPCSRATRRWATLKEWKQALTRRARDVGSIAENITSPFECFDSAIDSLRNMLDDDGPARTRTVCRRLGIFNEYAILKKCLDSGAAERHTALRSGQAVQHIYNAACVFAATVQSTHKTSAEYTGICACA